ncbi:glucans biosynthesis glucosyltransferase MdoH [Spongiibacter taiwanensis]|uniref:glucans biosynthesis glucosyltransferase MdoH n=1 Tax=Spongiibacter taiwanensis TaxID=1748242 RepID=UPI00203623D7|nr:glucans biosynthesis glucosyltransferase MdoH [Spongiibacter taiwanensis]USA44131.1 glucans biosynthesis glucosyltransferase MdoH [Spongiibacter taiwanensis]
MSGNASFPGGSLRLPIFAALCGLSTLVGVWMMFDILRANGSTPLELTLLVLFSVTFAWIVTAFWSAVAGFVLSLFRLDPLSLRRQQPRPAEFHADMLGRVAVVMPVYNEDTQRVFAGFESNLRSLMAEGALAHFDFWLLSDTRDPEIAVAEQRAWQGLLSRLDGAAAEQVFYRRRKENSGRKVGNLKDFCQRWGSRYEAMIVLDADSVMSGRCMLQLARAMADSPGAGLIQTVPIPVRQETFFGRFLQFASVLYSPMLAAGQAFWQTDSANYWGHNAIIRTRAFMQHCGLPAKPGGAPFGGEILSHDFVEAALLRRAGWQVLLLSDLGGSYEEVPSNMLDYATRDRRWAQGNIQHLGLLNTAGLKGASKMHFVFGALAYMSSLIWLVMMALSTVDAINRSMSSNQFFFSSHQLFPEWPIAKTGLIFSLITLTLLMLLLPKAMGLVVALLRRRRAFGGGLPLLAGAVVEMIFAVVVAPLMMLFHAYFVVAVLLGREVRWDAQAREGRMVSWREAWQRTSLACVAALAWGGVTYAYSPVFFWWLSPVLLGLVLAAPLVRYSSSLALGRACRRGGVFIVPSEARLPAVLAQLAEKLASDYGIERPPEGIEGRSVNAPPLPAAQWADMPLQRLDHYPGASRGLSLRRMGRALASGFRSL